MIQYKIARTRDGGAGVRSERSSLRAVTVDDAARRLLPAVLVRLGRDAGEIPLVVEQLRAEEARPVAVRALLRVRLADVVDPAVGDGAFPCREPCSVVVSAARKWTRLESERPRTYEFDLTPSEKEQVEAIIDAVADGRIDDIREADTKEGANRYRTRFLRAKLFDDEGNLAGVPTEPDEDGGE